LPTLVYCATANRFVLEERRNWPEMPALLTTSLPFPVRGGKVRDVYDLGDRLLLVATDRISAFDWVMPNGIPDKGRILTQISAFWFDLLGVPSHVISQDLSTLALPPEVNREQL